jgi:hypothetical protein
MKEIGSKRLQQKTQAHRSLQADFILRFDFI